MCATPAPSSSPPSRLWPGWVEKRNRVLETPFSGVVSSGVAAVLVSIPVIKRASKPVTNIANRLLLLYVLAERSQRNILICVIMYRIPV